MLYVNYKDTILTYICIKFRMSTNLDDHTLVKQNDYQEVKVDYADPESPTQRDPLTPVTSAVADIDSTAANDTVQKSGLQSQTTVLDTDRPPKLPYTRS